MIRNQHAGRSNTRGAAVFVLPKLIPALRFFPFPGMLNLRAVRIILIFCFRSIRFAADRNAGHDLRMARIRISVLQTVIGNCRIQQHNCRRCHGRHNIRDKPPFFRSFSFKQLLKNFCIAMQFFIGSAVYIFKIHSPPVLQEGV